MAVGGGPVPDDAAVLDVWERSSALERPWRELALLELTGDEPVEAARLPLGERDRRLLALRASLFGRWIPCETRCGACDERLELELDGEGLAVDPASTSVHHERPRASVGIRPPDSTDIAAALAPTIRRRRSSSAASILGGDRRRCRPRRARRPFAAWPSWTPARRSGSRRPVPPAARRRPCCSIRRPSWSRRSTGTPRRILREVDQLARAYGWREPDVLALGPARRRAYLGLVAS